MCPKWPLPAPQKRLLTTFLHHIPTRIVSVTKRPELSKESMCANINVNGKMNMDKFEVTCEQIFVATHQHKTNKKTYVKMDMTHPKPSIYESSTGVTVFNVQTETQNHRHRRCRVRCGGHKQSMALQCPCF